MAGSMSVRLNYVLWGDQLRLCCFIICFLLPSTLRYRVEAPNFHMASLPPPTSILTADITYSR